MYTLLIIGAIWLITLTLISFRVYVDIKNTNKGYNYDELITILKEIIKENGNTTDN